jgi:hypothetical protein
MPPRVWSFLRNHTNREILSWLGGGIVVVVTGIWFAIIHFFPTQKPAERENPHVQASCGGVAIGGNVTGATIKAGIAAGSDCSMKPESAP